MFATRIHAVALSMEASKSFARRRLRQSQAKVRSTTHRRGSTSKPFAVLGRGMISIVHLPSLGEGGFEFSARVCAVGKEMAQPGIEIPHGLDQRDGAVAVLVLAPWTITASSKPMVSTRICRLRPFTFLPAS